MAITTLNGGALPQEVAAMTGVTIESMCTAFMQDDFRYSLRQELQSIVKKLCNAGQHAPLIIMVDELDRCRPDFAIALLEDIKHLFSVEGVVFVLAVEKEQLKKCINATYGLNRKGAHTYLGKFIDMTLELPPPDPKAIFRLLLASYPLCNPPDWHYESPYGSSPSPSFADLAETILEQFPLSARDLSQVMCQLSIIVHLPRIDLLAAITCVVLLGHMQSGALPEHGWKSIGFNRDNYALLQEKLLDVGMLFPGIFKPYREAIRHKTHSNGNDNFLKTAEREKSHQIEGTIPLYTSNLYDFLSAQMRCSPSGDEWKKYVNALLLLINKTNID